MKPLNVSINFPKLEEIDYVLPEERIAKYPLENRHDSKILVYNKGSILDTNFQKISEALPKHCLLVFNDTKVIRARLIFHKKSGAPIEIFCLEPFEPAEYETAFSTTRSGKWKCLVGNLKKWKDEELLRHVIINKQEVRINARKIEVYPDCQIIEFVWSADNVSFADLLESAGETPIPPYLKRDSEPLDQYRYQTIYAQANGSVAAPTAGLHFTTDVIASIKEKGMQMLSITLHVGAGTFRPIYTDSINNHIMHSEHFIISRANIELLLQFKGNVIAIGTTSVRTLESIFWCGVKLLNNKEVFGRDIHIDQWEWTKFSGKYSVYDSLTALLHYMDKFQLSTLQGSTQLMIIPGYGFNLIDGMVSNFHQPKSTLLLLVSALIGKDWKKVYHHGLMNQYRFLSYGDSTLLLKPRQMGQGE
jgi:S-adenosylmethionine:tRNA ribosyltransferase-isomerase